MSDYDAERLRIEAQGPLCPPGKHEPAPDLTEECFSRAPRPGEAGYGFGAPRPGEEGYDDIDDRIESLAGPLDDAPHPAAADPESAKPPKALGAWIETWAEDGDPLATRPAPQMCVLRLRTGHQTSVPYLPQTKLAMLAGMGGVNKSRLALYWSVAVATGRPVFGELYCPSPGPVAIVSAEDERDEVHRRLEAIGRDLALTADERRAVARNLWIGTVDEEEDDDALDCGSAFLAPGADGRTLVHSPYAIELRRQLTAEAERRDGFRLVVLDPLVAFAPADAEVDNGVAFRTMRAFRRLTRLPGRPSVLLLHHATKTGREGGGVNSVRGSGALTDNARWVAVMTSRGRVKKIETVKSNATAPHTLFVEQNDRGDLRASNADAWEALEPDDKPTKKREGGW